MSEQSARSSSSPSSSSQQQQQQQQQQEQKPKRNGPNNLLKRWKLNQQFQNISQNLSETFNVTSKSFMNSPSSPGSGSSGVSITNPATERTYESLPPAPKGMDWIRDDKTKEWRLKKKEVEKEKVVVVVEQSDDDDDDDYGGAKEEEKEEEKVEKKNEEEEVTAVEGDDDNNLLPKEEEKEETKEEPNQESTPIFQLQPSYIPLTLPPRKSSISSSGKHSHHSQKLQRDSSITDDSQEGWSLISDTNTLEGNKSNSSGIIVSLASLRSSTGNSSWKNHNNANHILPPIPLERSWSSSSTIASNDETGYGTPGIDYLEHVVLPTDTIEGICLAYKISRTRLRQANTFSGSSLCLAPKKLVIPLSKKAFREAAGSKEGVRMQNTSSQMYKIQAFLVEMGQVGSMTQSEAKTYLDLSNWDLEEALRTAYEDLAWDTNSSSYPKNTPQQSSSSTTTVGKQDIRITLRYQQDGKKKEGEGESLFVKDEFTSLRINPSHYDVRNGEEEEEDVAKDVGSGGSGAQDIFRRVQNSGAGIPASLRTKTVTVQDVYQASLSHDLCGVELKEFSSPSSVSQSVDVLEEKELKSSESSSVPLPRF